MPTRNNGWNALVSDNHCMMVLTDMPNYASGVIRDPSVITYDTYTAMHGLHDL